MANELGASDPLSEIVRIAEEGQVALGRLRSMVEDTATRVAEIARANAVFESIADRLIAITLKASKSATEGGASPAFVEELADLARRSLLASSDGRSQIREYQKTALPTKAATHEAHTAMDALSTLLKQLASLPTATEEAIPIIEVESRPPPLPEPAAPSASWRVSPPKAGRYKN